MHKADKDGETMKEKIRKLELEVQFLKEQLNKANKLSGSNIPSDTIAFGFYQIQQGKAP